MASVVAYRIPSGEKRWRCRYRDAGGREHSKSFIRAKDAARYRVDVERRAQLGALYVAPSETFGEFTDSWFARWMARTRPAPSTADGVRRNLQLHLEPLRPLPLEAITATMFEDVIHEIASDQLCKDGSIEKLARPRTAQHAFETGRRVLREAQSRGQNIDEQIFELERPGNDERDPIFLTWPQTGELAACSSEPCLIEFAALSGLRLGELAALIDSDLDLAGSAVTVCRSGYRGQLRQRTKTRQSVRRVPLCAQAVQVLREQLLARTPSRLVFPAEDGEQWTKRALHRRFRRAIKRFGMPEMHFHDLRHTFVSLMAAAGVGAAEIAAMVGHADGGVLVARRYRHLFPDALTISARKLDLLIATSDEAVAAEAGS